MSTLVGKYDVIERMGGGEKQISKRPPADRSLPPAELCLEGNLEGSRHYHIISYHIDISLVG